LSQRVPEQLNHKLYADNYFTSVPLIRYLSSKGVCHAGTVRSNRVLGCQLPNNKKSEWGTIHEIVSGEGDIVVTQWSDNRTVLMTSNFVGKGTIDQVRCWSKVEKDYVHVSRPEVTRLYNSSMGGTDKMDYLLQLYRTVKPRYLAPPPR